MSDKVFNIKLTEREIDLLHQCISTNTQTVKRRHNPRDPMIAELLAELGELSDDLLEQFHRHDDEEWSDPEDPDLFMDPIEFAEKHDPTENHTFTATEQSFIQAGINGREKVKESSRAAERRNFNLKVKDKRLSKTQTHDVWDANDPKNW